MMSFSEKDVSMQKVEEETNELRRKYPLYTAILESIPDMDLKEVVSVMMLVDGVRWLLKTHAMKLSLIGEDKVTDQMVEEKINELKTKYASLASVLERIHKMDLKETTIGLFGIDAMESLLKLRALVILAS
jgi:2-iminoacetate synthase ThiH